jgi:glutamate dehydrogenase
VKNVDVIHLLYDDFAARHSPEPDVAAKPTEEREADIRQKISKIEDEFDQEVLLACMQFNKYTKRTNIWRRTKSALVLDLDPCCIEKQTRRYPVKPYCIFLVIGSDFRGFHVRFNDIARGGVRLVKSRSDGEWTKNAAELFYENYNLALTQQKKNKDIPEGGSKGVILINAKQEDSFGPFSRYMDGVLDMLVPEQIEPPIIPTETKPKQAAANDDIIFIGPDENTAGETTLPPPPPGLHHHGYLFIFFKFF